MSYMDMTFCPFTACTNMECFRRLTPEVIAKAEKWWGGPDSPICMFVERPDCFEKKEVVGE